MIVATVYSEDIRESPVPEGHIVWIYLQFYFIKEEKTKIAKNN